MSEGVFQTDRAIFESDIWLNIVEFRLFFYIYGNAVFNKCGVNYNEVNIKRGQYLRSYRNLQKDLEYVENRAIKQYPLSRIKRAIDKLIIEKRLIVKHTELGTLFTVLNYEEYQGFERFKKDNMKQQWNSDGTAMEQRWNNNKKEKKVKNVKKDKYNSIFDYWNTKEIMIHRKLNQIMKNEIDKALKDYTMDEIKTSIDHYEEAYKSKYQYCNYKWGLDTFLKRAEGYTKFLEDGDKWIRYSDWTKNPNKSQEDNKPKTITRFHNFEQRTSKYTAKELDDIAKKIRKKHSDGG